MQSVNMAPAGKPLIARCVVQRRNKVENLSPADADKRWLPVASLFGVVRELTPEDWGKKEFPSATHAVSLSKPGAWAVVEAGMRITTDSKRPPLEVLGIFALQQPRPDQEGVKEIICKIAEE